MSIKHIIVKINQAETPELLLPEGETSMTVSLDQGDDNRMLRSSILTEMDRARLILNNSMYDLLNFALGLYTIDQTVSRSLNGFQGWSRYLIVHFAVHDVDLWNNVKESLENYIGFLSGDKWIFNFRKHIDDREVVIDVHRNADGFTKVSLLSGGLDSFIGAIDLLGSDNEKPFFVSHYKTGTESSAQEKVLQGLITKFGSDKFASSRFYVQPNQKNVAAQKENSSRARSLLFICLGLAVANSLGDDIPLILPENGLISLNIPLTKTRLSSHSTRTTHPYFVGGLNHIFGSLGVANKIINPYKFKTKGEMMLNCKDREFLHLYARETISCSHPENSRYARKAPGLNCGYCVPCIIRQSAEKKFGEISTAYALDDVRKEPPSQKTKKGADYRAFKMAIEKLDGMSARHSLALQISRSGPIPYENSESLDEYISVYVRGMNEVKDFLNS
ncbi:Qat anti-phage system QueC-like protein QatC [Olivibacter jilunii]|uniref:Qat anti-phage system QueC-like protein QatC n=1 Tax=Olivibacter jilunii TaxID=985016 RepID=UPI001030053B|nr:Qat anti-phage system QueC-like protein QatC [Olivibacter jilunii]